MATDLTSELTEVELLHQYIGLRLQNGARQLPLEQLMSDFAVYRSQLDEWRSKVREGLESLDRGEGRSLDVEDIIRRGRERMAAEGIVD